MSHESHVRSERQRQIDLYNQEVKNKEEYEKSIENYKKLIEESHKKMEFYKGLIETCDQQLTNSEGKSKKSESNYCDLMVSKNITETQNSDFYNLINNIKGETNREIKDKILAIILNKYQELYSKDLRDNFPKKYRKNKICDNKNYTNNSTKVANGIYNIIFIKKCPHYKSEELLKKIYNYIMKYYKHQIDLYLKRNEFDKKKDKELLEGLIILDKFIIYMYNEYWKCSLTEHLKYENF